VCTRNGEPKTDMDYIAIPRGANLNDFSDSTDIMNRNRHVCFAYELYVGFIVVYFILTHI
jgi:hypothetical protein